MRAAALFGCLFCCRPDDGTYNSFELRIIKISHMVNHTDWQIIYINGFIIIYIYNPQYIELYMGKAFSCHRTLS